MRELETGGRQTDKTMGEAIGKLKGHRLRPLTTLP